MRLLFREGKQKELFKKEKEKLNLSWPKFAKYLNMKYGKLWSFVNESILVDEVTFNKLSLRKKYKNFLIKKLDNNWGQSKGGKNSHGKTKEINIPERNDELAEFWGIVLGDGHIQKRMGYKLGVYNIKITGHSFLDRDYLLKFVKPLIEKLFNIKVRFYKSKRSNALNVVAYSRKIVDFFEEDGFKPGNKIKNKVTIPKWIKNDSRFLAACLRGLIDTDGSFYRLTKQNSYQINFKNHNKKLLYDFRDSLIRLGLNPSKIFKGNSIVITKKSEIEKFYKLIGFSNPKHLNKIKKLF